MINNKYYNINCIYAKYSGRFITYSLLKELKDSEEKLIKLLLHKQENRKEFVFGNFIHSSLLEPDKVMSRFFLNGEITLDKNAYNQFGIDPNTWSMGQVMCRSNLKAHKTSFVECSLFFQIKMPSGIIFYVKGIADEINICNNLVKIRDIKTTYNLGKYFFHNKVIEKYDYDLQAFIYYLCASYLYCNYSIIFEISFIEKMMPWRYLNIVLEDEFLISGKKKFIDLLYKLENFLKKYNLINKFFDTKYFNDCDFIL